MNTCRGCAKKGRLGSCMDPVAAGLAPTQIVVFAPEHYQCEARVASEVSAPARQMPAWGDKEIGRFNYRVSLFMRRGLLRHAAEEMADRLALRDYERDDRRVCMECSHLQRNGRCFIAQRRLNDPEAIYPDRLPLDTLPSTLQRCNYFEFQTP